LALSCLAPGLTGNVQYYTTVKPCGFGVRRALLFVVGFDGLPGIGEDGGGGGGLRVSEEEKPQRP
jgi:hypothetical protein